MLAKNPLCPCDRSANPWPLSHAEQTSAPFRTAPGAKKLIIVCRSAFEAKLLVESLRPPVCALCAQPDTPCASLSHGLDGQTEGFESEAFSLLLRHDRDPIEVSPGRKQRHAEIAHRLVVCLD